MQPHATRSRIRTPMRDLAACALGLTLIGLLAWRTGQPLLFPSLGPTLMLVVEAPTHPSSRPLNVAVGHFVGLGVGFLAIVVTGLVGAPPVTEAGVNGPRVLAAALALGLTTAILRLVGRSHPPAGATTLIVALGLLDSPSELAAMSISFLLLTALCATVVRYRNASGRPDRAGTRRAEDESRTVGHEVER
jgi:CBS domain-containing membrane protein